VTYKLEKMLNLGAGDRGRFHLLDLCCGEVKHPAFF